MQFIFILVFIALLIVGLFIAAVWSGIECVFKLCFGGNEDDRRTTNKCKRYKK